VLSVFGGKITTYRRLAEAALEQLLSALGHADPLPWTHSAPLPGGDVPGGDLQRFTQHTVARWPQLPPDLLARYARLYGTRLARLVNSAQQLADLGEDFGGGLMRAEVDYLVREEWARTAEDILWRRTKLGLAGVDVARLQVALAQTPTSRG
jgi:glycerol-3-phosphate dehydrogenase